MKRDKLLKLLHIKPVELNGIKTAVAEAEKKTTGEIAVAAIYQSDSYMFVELLIAFCTAIVSFFVMLAFSNKIWNFLETKFWLPHPARLTAFIGLGMLIVTAAVYALLNIPAVDRLVIPNKLKNRRIYARALQHFVESGVYKTADRTGVLIFISVLEKRVFIITDSAVKEKIPQSEWQRICKIITDGLRAKQTANSVIAAVKECGKILSASFPNKQTNPNELADGLVLLES
ncbi:TPM domain-containing protein [Treponema pedis]|uniref:TPM domain-containing protein n=1 Tax=Treponema pedis TaxID=409322 RepID=UPI000409EB36|nr:TPM domain-containing protein [Treponema pedis]